MIVLKSIPATYLAVLLVLGSHLRAEDSTVDKSPQVRDSISELARMANVPRHLSSLRKERGAAVLYRVFKASGWGGHRVTGTVLVSISPPYSSPITGLTPGQAWVEYRIVSPTGVVQGKRQLSLEETKLILRLIRQEEVFRLPEQEAPEGLVEDDGGQYEIYLKEAPGVYLERSSAVDDYRVLYRAGDSGGPVMRVVDKLLEVGDSALPSPGAGRPGKGQTGK